jgi:hypothetical protein
MEDRSQHPPDPRPRVLGDERRHYLMAAGMANRTGADMQAALDAGVISQADWADLVQRCRACDWTEGCACWLKAQSPGGADAPGSCPNAAVFKRVKALTEVGF